MPKPRGRPPRADRERQHLQDTLLERHASGESITAICRDLKISIASPWRWSDQDPDGFGTRYARAREEHAHALAASVIDIADGTDAISVTAQALAASHHVPDEDKDRFLRTFGNVAVQRDRLRVEARKWVTAKALPRIYSEKQQVDVTSGGEPLVVQFVHEGARRTAS